MDSMGNYVYGATATAHNADGTATAITGMTKANGSWDFDDATTDLEPIKIGEKSIGGNPLRNTPLMETARLQLLTRKAKTMKWVISPLLM